MKRFLFFTACLLLLFHSAVFAKRYTYLTYNEMLDKMTELSQRYPRYCKLFDVKQEYPHLLETTCGKAPCDHWYFQITDFNAPPERMNTLPQVLLMSGMYGDEVLGPNILINLVEHLLQKNEEEESITNLIKSRLLLILPIANPSGFYHNKKEERQGIGKYIDPNQDFPYNVPKNECMQTASARVVNHIFRKYLIQAAITIHSGDQQISYPWGASNHLLKNNSSQESPDDKAFEDLASILSQEAGSNSFLSIETYEFGRKANRAPTANGGVVDWAYAASWENNFQPNVIPKCEGPFEGDPFPISETEYSAQSARALMFLVEASQNKAPTSVYLGSTEGLEASKDKYAYGYIPMNIKLALTLVDLVEPYVKLTTFDFSEEFRTITIKWQGGGCKKVDETRLEWHNKEGSVVNMATLEARYGPGYYEDKNFAFQEIIQLNNTNFNLSFDIKLTCDQNWAQQTDPHPKISPQSHMVQSRTNQGYQAESHEYKIQGKKVVELGVHNLSLEYLMKTRITNIMDLTLVMEFTECSGLSVGTVTAQLVENNGVLSLQFAGKLNVEDPFLEGHLHRFGDNSRCQDSIGNSINTITLEDTENNKESFLFKMEKDSIRTVKINSRLELTKDHNILGFIGKSIMLDRNAHLDNVYTAQILPLQPSSCRKASHMKNCLGVSLGSNQGLCSVKVSLEDRYFDLKLFIEPGTEGKSVLISGLVPNELVQHYYKFEDIYIVHEKTEKKFTISKKLANGYGYIEPRSFSLYPDIALGSLLRVYIQNLGDELLIGDCSIVLADPSYNETEEIYETHLQQMRDKAARVRLHLLIFVLFCIACIVGGIAINFLVKRYKQVKKQTFEVAMSERKERYADTARMINSARTPRLNLPSGSAQDYSSPRTILAQKDSTRTELKRDYLRPRQKFRQHMELADLEEEEF